MTGFEPDDIAKHGVDLQALAGLIQGLNISRRNSRSYPEGHQVIDAALRKVLTIYAALTRAGVELVIAVAGDALLVGDTPLDRANLVYRDFARALHERGIGALVLRPGLDLRELRSFIAILATKREEIYQAGGIERVWEEAGIASLEVRAIRYELFGSTEGVSLEEGGSPGAPRGLWESFARSMLSGTLPGEPAEAALDPELLAELLNRQYLDSGSLSRVDAGALVRYLEESVDRESDAQVIRATVDPAYRKLAAFIGKLTPELRRQLLGFAFDLENIRSESAVERLIHQLPEAVVLETLKDIGDQQVSVPPFVLGLLRQMSRHGSSELLPSAAELSGAELHEKLRTIFKEHAMEEFIPDSYQHKLNRMMSADQLPLLGPAGVQDLMESFEAASQESKTGDILLLLLRAGLGSDEECATLARNLKEICTFFLQIGAYGQLLKILRQLACEPLPDGTREDLLELFASREFLDEVLDGLEIWGKGKFDEIAEVLAAIGAPCIEILLDRLAVAESMSLRRFLSDRLVEFGPAAAQAVVARLSDGRWYFLRNLIGVIRQSGLTQASDRLRILGRHRDPRISQEALKALLQFQDPETESKLLRELQGKQRETQLAALRLAGRARSAAVLGRLHAMLAAPGLSAKECELKGVVAQALGEIGNVQSLPVLEGVLASRSLFHPMVLNKLKMDIVASLWRYPAAAARPVLARLSNGGGAVAQQAAQLLCGAGRSTP